MSILIPSSINLHNLDPDSDPLDLEQIGSAHRHIKGWANLPLDTTAIKITNSTDGVLEGTAFNLPSSFDATAASKVLIWAFQFDLAQTVQVDTIANNGIVGRLYSSLNNYLEFRIGGNDTPAGSTARGFLPFVLDPNAQNYSSETGTFDLTTVSGYGWASTKKDLVGTNSTVVYFTRAFLFDTVKDGDLPTFVGNSNFDNIIVAVLGTDYTNKIHTFVSKVGNSYTLLCPWQIGDNGTTATNFNDGGACVISPSNNDNIDPRFHLSDQAMRVYLSLGASDTVTLSGIYTWGSSADWNFDSNVGATVVLNDATFSNMGNFTIGSDITTNGTTFSLATNKKVISNGATVDGITVKGTLELLNQTDLTEVRATKLTLTQAGAYNFIGCKISEIENTSGSVITITSDTDISIITETNGSIDLTVSSGETLPTGTYLYFDGIDSWIQYGSATDRESNTNSMASGIGTDKLTYTYSGETTFYLRLIFGDEVLFKNVTVDSDGQTKVSLGTPTLLNDIQTTMISDHTEIKNSLANGANKLNHTWEFLSR